MKTLSFLTLILFSFSILGCSLPSKQVQKQLYGFTKEEKKIKGRFGNRKSASIKDFRGNEMYEEDMDALKEEAEKYIAAHPDLSELTKANLRELKVSAGATKEEVKLLLGEPDKIMRASANASYAASEIWIYQIKKLRAINVFIVPVFFVHEGYYLYFKDDLLVGIERHYPKQMVEQSAGPGVYEKKGDSNSTQ